MREGKDEGRRVKESNFELLRSNGSGMQESVKQTLRHPPSLYFLAIVLATSSRRLRDPLS